MADNPRIDDLRRRLEREPGSRVFAQLAEELRKAGQLPEAIRVARQGLLNHPGYPSARMTLGRALLDSRDLRGARGEFEAVLRGAPDNILASRYLAEVLEALGDMGSALLQYRATLRLSPGDRNVEAQIRGLEERLTPGSPVVAESAAQVPARRPELARPGVIPVLEVDGPMELETTLESAPRWGAPAPDVAPASVPPAPFPAPPPPAGTAPPVEADDPHLFSLPAVPEFGLPTIPEPVPPSPPAEPLPAREEPPAPRAPESVSSLPFPEPATDPTAKLSEPSAPPPPPIEAPAQPLYSSTLAELYFQQGFTRQAIEVYEQLLLREPSSERLQARLKELRAFEREEGIASPPPPPTAAPVDDRARRRQSITRTIARLEGLMLAARRL